MDGLPRAREPAVGFVAGTGAYRSTPIGRKWNLQAGTVKIVAK